MVLLHDSGSLYLDYRFRDHDIPSEEISKVRWEYDVVLAFLSVKLGEKDYAKNAPSGFVGWLIKGCLRAYLRAKEKEQSVIEWGDSSWALHVIPLQEEHISISLKSRNKIAFEGLAVSLPEFARASLWIANKWRIHLESTYPTQISHPKWNKPYNHLIELIDEVNRSFPHG